MKSIAAFSNGEGGILIIGVSDEGQVLWLENDYGTLKGDKDKFELHLRNLVNKNFGGNFATGNLSITFLGSQDKEVCLIDIKRALQPKYLEVKDKNGQKTDKFYVRSGNSSIELPLAEAAGYIQTHFS